MPASPAPPRSSSRSSSPPLPPWLTGGGDGARRPPTGGGGHALRRLRGPALLAAGIVMGWLLHGRHAPPAVATATTAPTAPAPVCPPPPSPFADRPPSPAGGSARPAHLHARTATRPLVPLPEEKPMPEETRRAALRAFAQQKADDLRGCVDDPGRGPLRRVGAALEIDGHGAVATVQILGGEAGNRAVDSCYRARLKAWRFPQTLLQGDERLLVNFVL